mgnify:CR=1 FL=1
MADIYKNQLFFLILILCFIGYLYPLRNMSVRSNIKIYGLGISFATLAYKTSPLSLLVYLIISFSKGFFFTPFILLFISFILSIILAKLLKMLHIINFSTNEPPFMMALAGLGLIFSEIKLILCT